MVIELPASLQFLTQKQVAEVINVSERTLERWRGEGTGPKFVAMGPRRRLYRMSDVDHWARSQTFGSTSEAKREVRDAPRIIGNTSSSPIQWKPSVPDDFPFPATRPHGVPC